MVIDIVDVVSDKGELAEGHCGSWVPKLLAKRLGAIGSIQSLRQHLAKNDITRGGSCPVSTANGQRDKLFEKPKPRYLYLSMYSENTTTQEILGVAISEQLNATNSQIDI